MVEEKVEEIKQKLDELHRDYVLDQRELGKILIIVSTTLLIFSAHAALSFKSASESVGDLNEELSTISGVINSENFQTSIEAIESLNSRAISSQVNTAVSTFDSINRSVRTSGAVKSELRSDYELYQWLALLAILGEVAGIAVIYV